ncbi:MAG: hypothetical protein ACFCVD_04610 [Nodosilinea sp.]
MSNAYRHNNQREIALIVAFQSLIRLATCPGLNDFFAGVNARRA